MQKSVNVAQFCAGFSFAEQGKFMENNRCKFGMLRSCILKYFGLFWTINSLCKNHSHLKIGMKKYTKGLICLQYSYLHKALYST